MTSPFQAAAELLRELVHGAARDEAWILNRGDPGLLRSLDRLTAAQASAARPTEATVAAHVAHLAYGFELLNRWVQGEDPFEDADYAEAWRKGVVTDAEWATLRRRLAVELDAWQEAVAAPERDDGDTKHVLSSMAHLAYHLGAIRQIAPPARGPQAT